MLQFLLDVAIAGPASVLPRALSKRKRQNDEQVASFALEDCRGRFESAVVKVTNSPSLMRRASSSSDMLLHFHAIGPDVLVSRPALPVSGRVSTPPQPCSRRRAPRISAQGTPGAGLHVHMIGDPHIRRYRNLVQQDRPGPVTGESTLLPPPRGTSGRLTFQLFGTGGCEVISTVRKRAMASARAGTPKVVQAIDRHME